MQISSISFLGILQLIFLLAEIAFFLFLLLRFKAWHIRILEEKANLDGQIDASTDFEDFSVQSTTKSYDFDRERVQDLLDSTSAAIIKHRGKVKTAEDNAFLDKQEKFLATLVSLLGLSEFDAIPELDIPSEDNFSSDFEDEPVLDTAEESMDEDLGFEDLSDDFDDGDFSDFESADGMEEDFGNFDDFDDMEDFDETRTTATPATSDRLKEQVQEKAKNVTQDKGEPVEKASTQIDDGFNDDRLQQSLDDLDEFDFSDFEADLLND